MRLRFALLLVFAWAPAESRDFSGYRMDTTEELRLAATAAPESVTDNASYYVLGNEGFETAVAGSNGWHCFVQRAFFSRSEQSGDYETRIRAPHCINTEGASTRMQEIFMRTRLALEGKSSEQVDASIDAAYASGELRPPTGFAMTYMMSTEQWLGERIGAWLPHLMFWVPYLENDDVGGNPPLGELPFIASDSGTRAAVLIVPVDALPDAVRSAGPSSP